MNCGTLAYHLPDPILTLLDAPRERGHLDRPVPRHNHNTIRIGHDYIARTYPHISHTDRVANAPNLDPILARPHPASGGEHGVAVIDCAVDVTANAVDNGPGETAQAGILRQDVSPDRTVRAAAVVDHHDIPGRYVVDEVADAAGGGLRQVRSGR